MPDAEVVTPLIEGSEAFPAFEQAALEAEREILFGMRLFEADLPLVSDAARDRGYETWGALLAAKAAAGVDVRILLTDFEPILGDDLHRGAWRSLAGFVAAAEEAGGAEHLGVVACLHPGELGRIMKLLFWPALRWRLSRLGQRVQEQGEQELDDAPGLWRYIRAKGRRARVKVFPAMRLWPATYHQKMATFDGKRAIVGGIDLAGRMYDTPEHAEDADDTWHDVSLLVEGPVASAARRHLVAEWNANVPQFNARVTRMGAPFGPMAKPAAPLPRPDEPLRQSPALTFLRTRSRRSRSPFAFGPKPDIVEIEQATLDEISRAERLIYLESQYLRSPVIAEALARRGREQKAARLIVVLPAAPDDIAFRGNSGADAKHGEWLQVRALRTILDV